MAFFRVATLAFDFSFGGGRAGLAVDDHRAHETLASTQACKADLWVIGLRRRRPPLVVAVALANKTARIAWAVMHRHENYQRVAAAA